MAVTKKSNGYYTVVNKGEFVTLFAEGNAFLYPGAMAIVSSEKVNDETKKRWKEIGCEFDEVSEEKGLELLAQYGLLGVK